MNATRLSLGLSALLVTLNGSLHAAEIMQHHWHLAKVAVTLNQPSTSHYLSSTRLFWISFLQSRSQHGAIMNQADRPVVRVPALVRSPYDPGTMQNMRPLYESAHPRIAFIANFAVDVPYRSVLSIGLDTGHQSTKLQVDPSLYLGWASTLKNWGNASLSFSLGAWLGGDTTERSCLDNYSRAFQCHTMLPWTDKVDLQASQEIELSGAIRFERRF